MRRVTPVLLADRPALLVTLAGETEGRFGAAGVRLVNSVARIELGSQTYSLRSLLNNEDAAAIVIFEAPGANSIALSDAVRAKMAELESSFPEGVRWSVVYDPTVFVRQSIDAVITDPPYCSGGTTAAERARDPGAKYCQGGNTCGRPSFGGDTRDQRSFAYWCTLWLSLSRAACRESAYCLVFIDWRQLPAMTDAIGHPSDMPDRVKPASSALPPTSCR